MGALKTFFTSRTRLLLVSVHITMICTRRLDSLISTPGFSWPEAVKLVSKFYICFWHSSRVEQYSKMVREQCLSMSNRCSRNHFSVFFDWRVWFQIIARIKQDGKKGRKRDEEKEEKWKTLDGDAIFNV